MNAVINTVTIRQNPILHGDHHIITAVSLADGLEKLKAGMILYKDTDGYKPCTATLVDDGTQVPVAVLLEAPRVMPTAGAVETAAVHGAIRESKALYADGETPVTEDTIEALRLSGIYALEG